MTSVTITFDSSDYTATLDNEGRVDIDAGNVSVGSGTWNGEQIEDCAAVIPDEAYTALDAALREATA